MKTSQRLSPSPARRRSGFTLLEILLVVMIIGIVATIAIVEMDIGGTTEGVKIDATRVQVAKVANAIQLYRMHTGKLPSSLNDLKNNPGIEDWRGPYHKNFNDQWGNPLGYTVTGRDFEVSSTAGGSETDAISSNDIE